MRTMLETRRTFRVLAPAGAALILVGAASAALALSFPVSPRVTKTGALYSVVYGTRSYTFDAAWRTEKTWTRPQGAGAWTPVAPASAPWIEEFRATLLRDRGVRSLDGIPAEGEDEIAALHSLGYI